MGKCIRNVDNGASYPPGKTVVVDQGTCHLRAGNGRVGDENMFECWLLE